MNLEFYNCPKPEQFSAKILPKEKPEFVNYKPDFELLKKLAADYEKYDNILVIGQGGSINPFYGFYSVLKYQATKKVYFLNTVDPDYIFELKQKLFPSNTLVISISKSGENTTQLEETMPFANFPTLIITGKSSPLRAIAEKMKWPVIDHPKIGGRFTGLTEVNLTAAAIAGLDVEGLWEGGQEIEKLYEKPNLAFDLASVLNSLENHGYADVGMFFYSHYLFPTSFGIVQLCHESFGKNGKGQTYFAHEGPEVQHHTMQRYYGGQKNIVGLFLTVENFWHPTLTKYPAQIHSVQIKGQHLSVIDKVPLEKAFEAEWQANVEDSRIRGIPAVRFSLTDLSAKEVGRYTAFWQLFAVYSSLLRGVDPFDQPEVENSKKISFTKRLQYKGLL